MLGWGGVPASSQFLTIRKGGTSGNAPGRQHAHRQGRRQAADCQSDEPPVRAWPVTRRAAGRHQIGPRAPQPAQRTKRGARGEPATSYVGDTTTSRDPKTGCLYSPRVPCDTQQLKNPPPAALSPTPLQQSPTPSKVYTHHHDPRSPLPGHTGPNTGQYESRRPITPACDPMSAGFLADDKHSPLPQRDGPHPARQWYVSGTPPERSRHRTTKPKACGSHITAGWGSAVTGQRRTGEWPALAAFAAWSASCC